MQNEPDKSTNGFATPGKSIEFGVGATGLGSVGWAFGSGLRTELELDYRYNGSTKVLTPAASSPLGGSEQKFGPMANVLYDFNRLSPVIVPYLGVGAGYQWADVGGDHRLASGTEGAFAYQGIVGAALPVASEPHLSVTAEYRFMGLAGDRTYGSANLVRTDDFNHSILIGLHYAFGGTPMTATIAATPMPAPAPAHSYLVFFDWDKASLTARAQQIIKDAAESSTKVQLTRLEVNGYADTSGKPQYNQALSVHRAQVVAAELVRDGVPKAAIAIQGFGDTHLLVPTGANVRDPQNRRVEIIIR